MTTYENILTAVMKKLKNKFPLIEQESNDIEEGFKRPSFFATIDNIGVIDFMDVSKDNSMTIRIIYFPKHKKVNQVELLTMMNDLSDLFLTDKTLEISDEISVEMEEIKLRTIDKVLHCDFDLTLYENYNKEEDHEAMSDLQIELKG